MNESQQAHVDHFLMRIGCRDELKRDRRRARVPAAGDAEQARPPRNEGEGTELFEHLRGLEDALTPRPL